MSHERHAEISVPAESRYVALARNFVLETAKEAGWLRSEQLDDLRLMVSEIVTNAIRAQSANAPDSVIAIRSIAGEERFSIIVTDSAGGFETPANPVPVPPADFDRTGGFGLSLVGALADEVTFQPVAGGTQVTVTLQRQGPASEGTVDDD